LIMLAENIAHLIAVHVLTLGKLNLQLPRLLAQQSVLGSEKLFLPLRLL
jgi:hypothetical protein